MLISAGVLLIRRDGSAPELLLCLLIVRAELRLRAPVALYHDPRLYALEAGLALPAGGHAPCLCAADAGGARPAAMGARLRAAALYCLIRAFSPCC